MAITSQSFNHSECNNAEIEEISETLWARQEILVLTHEPLHEISNNVVCVTRKASDQPAHMRSLIRAFASNLNIL